jgi:two-component system response regulator AtoC
MVSPVAEKLRHNEAADSLPPEPVIFGSSEAMQAVADKVRKLAASNLPVLLQGESGTGKEVIARLLHERSPWREGPLIKINCPAIPKNLVESELFGSERGAFTRTYENNSSRAEVANGGTLFLDEIAELRPELQAKLLELLPGEQWCGIASQEGSGPMRIVCATSRNLEEEIKTGAFRRDLFYRINVVNIQLPPLRERPQDIPELVRYFLKAYNRSYNRQAPLLSYHLLKRMQTYEWPGNIRELENLMKRYVILVSEEAITSGLSTWASIGFPVEIPRNGSICLKKLTRQVVQELEGRVILREANPEAQPASTGVRHAGRVGKDKALPN